LGFIEILIGIHREITNQNWDFVGDGDNLLKKMHYMYYEDGLFRPHKKVGDFSAPMCMALGESPSFAGKYGNNHGLSHGLCHILLRSSPEIRPKLLPLSRLSAMACCTRSS